MRLNGKVALVTGSTKGIGQAIATMFAEEGASVILTGRSVERGEAVATEIRSKGGEASFIAADISQEDDVRRLLSEAADRYGRLDVLVNNAGPTEALHERDCRVTDLTTDNFDYIMKVGVYGPLWATKYAIPAMIAGGGGSIINISTYGSMFGLPGLPSYASSKAALNALTRQVAVDYAQDGVRCNALIVGLVLTDLVLDLAKQVPSLGAVLDSQTLTRPGKPEDIAYAAVYLASDESAFATGALIPIDGGMGARGIFPELPE